MNGLLPQQSISSVTNVDDLETYVGQLEKRDRKSYLSAVSDEESKKVNSLINVLIRLVGGTLKLALSKNCDTRKEFQRASAQRSLRMSTVVLFRRYRQEPEIFQVANQRALN